jgi:hypothetical protein
LPSGDAMVSYSSDSLMWKKGFWGDNEGAFLH